MVITRKEIWRGIILTLPHTKEGPKKRTSMGHSNRTRPKNKNKRRQYKKYNGQGK